MADETLKISVQVTGKEDLKAYKESIKEWRDALRLLELEFKKGKIAGGEFQIQSGKLTHALKLFEDGSGRTASAQQALWHANNRVTLGFKSLATEVTGIHQKMRPVQEQFREFYRQQRTSDRTMREGVQTLSLFSGVLGSEVGGALSTAANGFQQAEFAINGMGIAAQSSTGKIAALGTAIRGLAAPIAGLAAIAVAEFSLVVTMLDRIEAAATRIRKTQGKTEKAPNTWFMNLLTNFSGATGNAGLQAIGNLAKGVVSIEKSAWAAEHQIIMEEVVATGRLTAETEKLATAKSKVRGTAYGPDAFYGVKQTGLDIANRKRVGGRGYGGGMAGGPVNNLFGGEFGFKEPIEEARQEMSLFASSAVSSLNLVGSTISNSIGQGFVNAFGIGHTLLGQFASSFLTFLSGGLFNLISGGIGGLLGGAGGGGGGMFGGGMAGGGNIGGMTSRKGGMGGMMQPRLVAELKYDRLAFKIQQGDRTLAARSL